MRWLRRTIRSGRIVVMRAREECLILYRTTKTLIQLWRKKRTFDVSEMNTPENPAFGIVTVDGREYVIRYEGEVATYVLFPDGSKVRWPPLKGEPELGGLQPS